MGVLCTLAEVFTCKHLVFSLFPPWQRCSQPAAAAALNPFRQPPLRNRRIRPGRRFNREPWWTTA